MGFVGAFPLGRYALGLGATVDNSFAYQPVTDSTVQLKPGNQVRVRAGFEGPLGPRSYLRFAGVYAVRSKDKVGGDPVNSIGNRITGYLSVNQGVGSSALIFYGFDVYRANPSMAIRMSFSARPGICSRSGSGGMFPSRVYGLSLRVRSFATHIWCHSKIRTHR